VREHIALALRSVVKFPAADIGVKFLAARRAIGAQRVKIVQAVLSGSQIVIFTAPRVFG
jgi:predicted RNA polymerase sigma factor